MVTFRLSASWHGVFSVTRRPVLRGRRLWAACRDDVAVAPRVGLAGMAWLCQQVGVLTLPVAGALDLHDDGVMQQSVEQGRGHHRITEHLMMPWSLTGESLMSGWLIRITPCMAVVCWSVIVGPGVGLI